MNNLISVLIIDSDVKESSVLTKQLESDKRTCVVANMKDINKARNLFESEQPDVIFYNVGLQQKENKDLNSILKGSEKKTKVVYTSNQKKNVTEVLEKRQGYFLTKPYSGQEINELIDTIENQLLIENKISFEKCKSKMNIHGKIKLKNQYGFIFVVPHEIVYLRSVGAYCELMKIDCLVERIHSRISEISEDLKHFNFLRLNRSVLINLNYVYRINRKLKSCAIKCSENEFKFSITRLNMKFFDKMESLKLG